MKKIKKKKNLKKQNPWKNKLQKEKKTFGKKHPLKKKKLFELKATLWNANTPFEKKKKNNT